MQNVKVALLIDVTSQTLYNKINEQQDEQRIESYTLKLEAAAAHIQEKKDMLTQYTPWMDVTDQKTTS